MSNLFRKSTLDKLSSPEQLDKMIVITPPSFWIALAGAFLIIIVALIWSIFGKLPTKEETQGIYVNTGGSYSVYSEVSGFVDEVLVKEGDVVRVGDELVKLNPESIEKQISEIEGRIAKLEAVTLASKNEEITADNQNLLDIKEQIASSNDKTEADYNLELIKQKIKEQEQKITDTKATFEKAKKEYEDAIKMDVDPTIQTEKQEAYQTAANDYETAKATLSGLEDSKTQAEDSIGISKKLTKAQVEQLKEKFDATKTLTIQQLKHELEQYQEQLEDCTVKATIAGTVLRVGTVSGGVIQQGVEVVKVQQRAEDGQVVCYVPISSGKKLVKGMKVLIYPSTVNQQEYGHMEATIEHVDSYIASNTDLAVQLGDDSLVQSFLANGPVVAVTCKLRADEATASGYYWSSNKGKALQIAEGTPVSASVVLEEKAPITMLIPFLKEKLTIKVKAE